MFAALGCAAVMLQVCLHVIPALPNMLTRSAAACTRTDPSPVGSSDVRRMRETRLQGALLYDVRGTDTGEYWIYDSLVIALVMLQLNMSTESADMPHSPSKLRVFARCKIPICEAPCYVAPQHAKLTIRFLWACNSLGMLYELLRGRIFPAPVKVAS